MNKSRIVNIIIRKLTKSKLLREILEGYEIFEDEPKFYVYSAILNERPDLLNHKPIIGTGVSLNSKIEALTKCLGEFLERLCLLSSQQHLLYYSTYAKLGEKALDPKVYINKQDIRNHKLSWVSGANLITNKSVYIPTQLVFLNHEDKTKLANPISTGAAFGFTSKSAIIRGIYEVIERDAYMTFHLLKRRDAIRIDTMCLNEKKIDGIANQLNRHKLNLYVFNIANDLRIPTYLSLIVDRTRRGPAITIGTKSNMNEKLAIIGAIEESLHMRLYTRMIMYRLKQKLPYLHRSQVIDQRSRSLYWSRVNKIKELRHLLSIPTADIKFRETKIYKEEEELNYLTSKLTEKGYKIYTVDISIPILSKLGCFVYKTIIPGLQPLNISEKSREIVEKRLKQVANFSNIQRISINAIPHP